MTSRPGGVRRLAFLTIGAVLLFVALDVIASVAAGSGYSMRRDYVSSLAARGSSVMVLGQLSLIAFALAHLLGGSLMLVAWRTKVAGSFLALAGLLFLTVVLFRAECPDGAAGCGTSARGDASLEAGMHGVMAGTYALVMFFTMLICVASALWERGPNRVAGWLALPFWWLAFTGIGQMGKSDSTGAWERLWLGSYAVWLVLMAGLALAATRAPSVQVARRRTA